MSAGSAAMPDPSDWEKNDNQKGQPSQSKERMSGMSSPFPPASSPSSVSSSSSNSFLPLESDPPSPQRLSRIRKEAETKSKFVHGDELIEIRKYVQNIKADLKSAKETNDNSRIQDLTKALYDSQNLDAEYVYMNCLDLAKLHKEDNRDDKAEEYMKEALEARECLPQFNLQGLWVGKYGDHGYEMINVTYAGDTLIATKVTGDKNVPKCKITFSADLHPHAKEREQLEPIELSDVASKQWGHKYLPRFPGLGQVASEGFVNQQWMEGQLILVGEYFSFAWIPIGHQIFFGRPSAELTLKMLKQSKMVDFGANVDHQGSPNALAEMRAYVAKCFEETENVIDDELYVDDGELCFMMDDESYFCQDGCFE